MLSVVIEAFKSVMFLCTPFQIVVWYTATGLYITLHNSSARLDGIHPVQIHLIGIRNSAPDHRRVRNKKVTFYTNLLSGAEIYYPLSVLERVHIIEGFFKENIFTAAGLAWSVERLTAEREVAGSIPEAGLILRVLK